MAKKQKSFAEKATKHGGKDLVHVKFVKSVPSDREGFWRFNESMISMEKGQNLDAALKQIEDDANLADIEMPAVEAEVTEAPFEEQVEEAVESHGDKVAEQETAEEKTE